MDHPRMRGVYGDGFVVCQFVSGSSPHARGLPALRVRGTCSATDHPRMRGVYSLVIHCLREAGGSSPHARGLPHTSKSTIINMRIIPACAGFTRPRH